MLHDDYSKILDEISTLTKNYSNVYRGTVNYELYRDMVADNNSLDNAFDTAYMRESLISHVGHVNIVATYLHQFIQHRESTDLGHVLKILSIHDIWETLVWDVITTARNRTKQEEVDEFAAVKSLLHSEQLWWYNEMQELKTNEAKFAKSIDKICPDILAYCCDPKVEQARINHFGFTIDSVYDKKRPFMQWDWFLDWFFSYLIQKTQGNLKKVK